MAPVGQRSRQRVQPTIWERECAQRWSLKAMKRGLSKVPTRSRAFSTALSTAAGLPGSARRYPSRRSAAGNKGLPPERSRTTSQRDTAPSRVGPNDSVPREDGAACAKSSTVISKAPRCPLAERTVPFATGNSLTRGGTMAAGGLISTVISRCSFSKMPASTARSSQP